MHFGFCPVGRQTGSWTGDELDPSIGSLLEQAGVFTAPEGRCPSRTYTFSGLFFLVRGSVTGCLGGEKRI